MPRQIISSPNAPQAIGPYSQAVRAGDTVYRSGQIPLDPATGELVGGSFEDQARRVFENLKAVSAAAGASLDSSVRVTIYLVDLGRFPAVTPVVGNIEDLYGVTGAEAASTVGSTAPAAPPSPNLNGL